MPGNQSPAPVAEIRPAEVKPAERRTVSFSVDCDDLRHYANFAPRETVIPTDRRSFLQMCRDVAALLDRHGIRATFFCIAERLEDAETRAFFEELVAGGHAIGNHTYSHPDMGALPPAEQIEEVRRGHDVLVTRLNQRPRGYRGPAYHMTPELLAELCRLGYRYDSSVCHGRLHRAGLRLWRLVSPSFVPKVPPIWLGAFSRSGPSVISIGGEGSLLEWPIPSTFGVPFIGTLHAVLPKAVFHAQWALLNARMPHVHYEIHLIEALDSATAAAHPWVPTSRLPEAKRAPWLDERLAALATRRVTTLEELSAAHLPAVH